VKTALHRLETLSRIFRTGTAALDLLGEQLEPVKKYLPAETVDQLERVLGEGATQLEVAANATQDAATALGRLALRESRPDRE